MAADTTWLLIRNYNLWAHLTDEEYNELHVVPNFIQAPKGKYIYFEAYHHNRLYFLKEGYIRVGYINDSGQEVIKEIIQKGEIFGQIALEKNNLQGEFAQAYKTDVSVCSFTIDDFEKLLQKKPALALTYNRQVGAKLRQVENRLVNLLNKDVKSRLLGFLFQLARQHMDSSQAASSLCIPSFLTHEDIAHLIGSSRQTVTTLFNELAQEGVLEYNRHEIRFPDVNKIQKTGIVA